MFKNEEVFSDRLLAIRWIELLLLYILRSGTYFAAYFIYQYAIIIHFSIDYWYLFLLCMGHYKESKNFLSV